MASEIEEKVLTPQEVRKILNADNREIVELCRKASIVPKRNDLGQTYFSYDEVQHLRSLTKKGNSQAIVNNLLSRLQQMESNITDSVSKIMDEKLDGMDEVVIELIRCKTENESLRQKVNELNKENYTLKNTINSYKPVGLGLYIKKEQDNFIL